MYIIMEVQIFPDGGISTPCYAYSDQNKAEQKYHYILSSAAVSTLPIHTCFMLTDDGHIVKSESYEHFVDTDSELEGSEGE